MEVKNLNIIFNILGIIFTVLFIFQFIDELFTGSLITVILSLICICLCFPQLSKFIEQKIVGIKFDFPALNTIEGIDTKDKYVNIVYNNLKDCPYEKYNSLKIFCQDLKYKNKNNKWFFESISNKNNEYFNNCAFITNDIESIQMIIYLLYYYYYLNFKNFLKVKKIQKSDIIKIIFDDKIGRAHV